MKCFIHWENTLYFSERLNQGISIGLITGKDEWMSIYTTKYIGYSIETQYGIFIFISFIPFKNLTNLIVLSCENMHFLIKKSKY